MRLRYLPILLLTLAAFLIATAPAWLVSSLVASISNGQARLEEPDGGFWRGRAKSISLTFPDGSQRRFENLSWDVEGSRLLRGKIAAQVSLADQHATIDGVVTFSVDGLWVDKLIASLSADVIRAAAPKLEIWEPGGVVRINAEKLGLKPLRVIEPATVQWSGAQLNFIQAPQLGDYELRIFPNGENLKFDLKTTRGILRINGAGQYAYASGGEFRGNAKAAPAYAEHLAPVLRTMGPINREGGVDLILKLPPR